MHPSLQVMLDKAKIPHALVFAGGTKMQRQEMAQQFAAYALKTKKEFHPDIHHYQPEGKLGLHTIDALRSLTEEVAMLPVSSPMQFFIVHDASQMLPASSNALLKTLEEPLSHSVIILLVDRKEKLLPTIVSRCQTIAFQAAATNFSDEQMTFLDLLTGAVTFEQIEEFAKAKEESKKDLEKKLLKQIPKDLTPIQRETREKEVEGTVSLRFKEEILALFEVLALLVHDQTLCEIGFKPTFEKKLTKKIAFDAMQGALKTANLSLERSISFSSILLSLCLQLKII